jgi:hypothetical protein
MALIYTQKSLYGVIFDDQDLHTAPDGRIRITGIAGEMVSVAPRTFLRPPLQVLISFLTGKPSTKLS